MKLTSILLLFVLLLSPTGAGRAASAAVGQQQQTRDAARVEKVKRGVLRLGVGESARVEVKLLDGSKLKGYVRESGEDGFVVVDRKTGAARAVTYEQVERLKGNREGDGMSTGVKIAIGFGIAAGVLATLALIGLSLSD